jgi:hypothetical protein
MRKISLYLSLILLFISQSVYANKSILNELVEDVTNIFSNYYMEYYILSGERFLWLFQSYVDWSIKYPYSLDGWHGIVPYNLYRSKVLALKDFKLKGKKADRELEEHGLKGNWLNEIYTFKKHGSPAMNQALYTIEFVVADGISITKYDENNNPIIKQFFEYNEKFGDLLRAIIPPNQLQSENGWKANFKYKLSKEQ